MVMTGLVTPSFPRSGSPPRAQHLRTISPSQILLEMLMNTGTSYCSIYLFVPFRVRTRGANTEKKSLSMTTTTTTSTSTTIATTTVVITVWKRR
ncbi:hypothetical protein DM02DRAFT_43595 [Periconia macrospinosa]|uniref:Uncharacterized protein n=1 Tax=Periconia macrospinosa TaxID=97972 RepID=A0A2V1CX65_9PLEO|nr:hypothetical protein DM02DRAFT_43595 [Periconia macrospinosa]